MKAQVKDKSRPQTKPHMVHCRHCGQDIPHMEFMSHRWQKHKAQALADSGRHGKNKTSGTEVQTSGPAPGGKGDGKAAKPAATLAEAQTLAIYPREFRMSSTLVWQAREAAIREWGWPPDISAEDFLDTYLFLSFRQRGIVLGAYQVVGHDGHS